VAPTSLEATEELQAFDFFCYFITSLKELFPVALQRTFAIIKPDAVSRGLQGEILSRINKAGFQIVAIKSMRLTKEEAGGFYAVHKERPFFGELTDFMSSGKIIAMVLEAEGAILKWRQESCSRHHSPRPRHQHRQQRHPRLGRSRNRRV
jgi:nucleoside diphosphate kinase